MHLPPVISVVEALAARTPASKSIVIRVLCGSMSRDVAQFKSLPVFGCAKNELAVGAADTVVEEMALQGLVQEVTHRNEMPDGRPGAVIVAYAPAGGAAGRLRSGQERFMRLVDSGSAGAGGPKSRKKAGAARGDEEVGVGAGASAPMPARAAAAPSAGQRARPAAAVPTTRPAPARAARIVDVITISDGEDSEDEEVQSRRQVLRKAMDQLNQELRKERKLKRGPLTGTVQAQLVARPPRSAVELDRMAISGLSASLKKQYGRYIMQAVAQADAYVRLVLEGVARVEDFELDAARAWTEAQSPDKAARGQVNDGWSSDEDDGELERAVAAAEAAPLQGRLGPVAAPHQHQHQQPFTAYRYPGPDPSSRPHVPQGIPAYRPPHQGPEQQQQQGNGGMTDAAAPRHAPLKRRLEAAAGGSEWNVKKKGKEEGVVHISIDDISNAFAR
jgi:hypothetical protein